GGIDRGAAQKVRIWNLRRLRETLQAQVPDQHEHVDRKLEKGEKLIVSVMKAALNMPPAVVPELQAVVHPADRPVAVSVSRITKAFGGQHALNSATLDVYKGEFFS